MTADVAVFENESDMRYSICESEKDAPAPAANSFSPVKGPTWETVEAYAVMRGSQNCARPFFEYYSAAGWRDKEGVPCAWNWQAKFIAWEMREARQKKPDKQETPWTYDPGDVGDRSL